MVSLWWAAIAKPPSPAFLIHILLLLFVCTPDGFEPTIHNRITFAIRSFVDITLNTLKHRTVQLTKIITYYADWHMGRISRAMAKYWNINKHTHRFIAFNDIEPMKKITADMRTKENEPHRSQKYRGFFAFAPLCSSLGRDITLSKEQKANEPLSQHHVERYWFICHMVHFLGPLMSYGRSWKIPAE